MPDESLPRREQRRTPRTRVLKGGQVIVGNVTYDCMVLDISPHGARVKFNIPLIVPESVILRIRDGATYPACRRWSRGTEVGLEFAGPPLASGNEGHSRRALEALDAIRAASLTTCSRILQEERYFGDEALRRAAQSAELAYDLLLEALKPHAEKAVLARAKPIG